MDLGATPIFEISMKNCKSEPELKFEVKNRNLILPQRKCALFGKVEEIARVNMYIFIRGRGQGCATV